MHRTLLLSLLLLLACSPFARAEDPLVGKRVVVIRDNATLEASGKEVAKVSECSVFTVGAVEGSWLWIKSERAYLRRADVVPFDEAIGHYTRLLEANKTANNYSNRAKLWRLKGELDLALGDMNDAIRLNPTESVWFLKRGILWGGKKEYEKAIGDFNEAIRLNPKSGSAYASRGKAWGLKKDYDKEIADYDEALKHKDPNEKTGTLNDSEITGGDSKVMVNSRAMTFNSRGSAWGKKGNYDKAIADFEEAIRIDPKDQMPRINRRIAWNLQKAWDKIIADCDTSIAENRRDADLFNWRGHSFFQKQDYDKALADYEEAIRLDPKFQVPRNNRRSVWEKKGEWEKVFAEHDAAIQADPQNVQLAMDRASAWGRRSDFEKQFADYELVILLDPKHAAAWNGKAWLRATWPDEKHRNGPQAVEYATKACELTAWKDASHIGTLAAAYAEAGDFDRAIEFLDKSDALDSKTYAESHAEMRKLFLEKKPYREPAK